MNTVGARVAAIGMLVLLATGCGPTPPQAPLDQAKKLDESLGGISTACGEAYQLSAFPPHNRSETLTLEATASSDARKLASVYARNPEWIYQGESIRGLVHDSWSTLNSCGLSEAARALVRDTAHR